MIRKVCVISIVVFFKQFGTLVQVRAGALATCAIGLVVDTHAVALCSLLLLLAGHGGHWPRVLQLRLPRLRQDLPTDKGAPGLLPPLQVLLPQKAQLKPREPHRRGKLDTVEA